MHRELFTLRNDVMHFHSITYKTYQKALKLFKKINEELNAQLKKGIVLDNTEKNANFISSQYIYTLTRDILNSMLLLYPSLNTRIMSIYYELSNTFKFNELNTISNIVAEARNSLMDEHPKR